MALLRLDRALICASFAFIVWGQVCSQVPNPLKKDSLLDGGIRFGTTRYSRQEFVRDSGFLESVLHDSVFSLEFKTSGESGVLFYGAGMAPRTDFQGLFMQDGKITYAFDCGSGPAVMTSTNKYNDGKWHHVIFSRRSKEGRLVIDDEKEVRGTSPGYAIRPDVKYPFYVGGLSETAAEESKNFLNGTNSSFPGCIRNVEAQGELWTVEKQSSAWNTTSCSSTVKGGSVCTTNGECYVLHCECGDHTIGCKFQEDGIKKCLCGPGYEDQGGKCKTRSRPDPSRESSAESVRFGSTPYSRQEYTLDSEFLQSIWDDNVFSLDFKTLGESGVIFYVGGLAPNIDHIGLFMQDGKLTYVFDCGSGDAVITSQNTYNDGEWHQVIFSRQGREGRMVIDDKEEVRGTSPGNSNRMDTNSLFYVGGLAKNATKKYKNYLKGVYLSFPGCIRNVEAQGVLWTSDKLSASHDTTTCSSKVEGGTFFYSNGGYLVLHCNCGDHSTGCRFKEDGTKECLCSEGYVHKGDICAASSVNKVLEDVDYSEVDHVGQCVLPLNPLPDRSADPSEGIRFGNTPNSRQEFAVDAEFLDEIRNDSVFSLNFKTTGDSGVLFYIGGRDQAKLFMKHGRILFVFDLATGSTALVSRNRYNDGAWHHVAFWRHVREGRLVVDGVDSVQGSSPGIATFLDVKSPFYVGGLSEEAEKQYVRSPRDVSASFPGCIRDVKVQSIFWTPEKQSGSWNTSTCSTMEEKGAFFYADGGYLVLFEKFRVGQEISFSMDIKPRSLSGVLLAVHGRQDYLVLQLVNGTIEFTVDNGAGPVTTTYTPTTDEYHLCDGKFHTIRVTSKSNNKITLSVDEVLSEKELCVGRVSSTDTFDPLYFGGLPSSTLAKKGVKTTDQYVGCVRNLELNNDPLPMGQAKAFGQVTLNTCPTT